MKIKKSKINQRSSCWRILATSIIIFFLSPLSIWAQPNACLAFDGVNDEIIVPNYPGLNFLGNAITISAWIYLDSLKPEITIVNKSENGQCKNYGFYIKDGYLNYASGSNCSWNAGSSALLVPTEEWVHVAVTTIGNLIIFYLNGTPSIPKLFSNDPNGPVTTDALLIGNSKGVGLNNHFPGKMDQLRIWWDYFDEHDISIVYSHDWIIKSANLALAMDFDDGIIGANNTALQYVANGAGTFRNVNDGVLNNFALSGGGSNFISQNIDSTDHDGDGWIYAIDNCRNIANASQFNADNDLYGDACDNCTTIHNDNQQNSDSDSYGDACDNCAYSTNEDQLDINNDGIGDACAITTTDVGAELESKMLYINHVDGFIMKALNGDCFMIQLDSMEQFRIIKSNCP